MNIISLVYPQIIKSFPKSKGKLFITFDDGPNPFVTPLILDILKEYNAKATFFCTGENVEKYPELYCRILYEGHITGNHSYSHINGFKHSTKEYIENVEKADKIINSKIFRPPFGNMRPSQYKYLVKQYWIILWDIMAYDFDENLKPINCINNVIKKTKDGSIIVFHDNDKAKEMVIEVLPIILNHFKETGFSFECIKLL